MPRERIAYGVTAAACAFLAMQSCSQAQPFTDKTLTIYAGGPPGSGYDLYGRLLARHIGRHIPGRPNVVVSDMPAAAGIACANFIYGAAPKDGTALGIFSQGMAEDQVFETDGVRFDVSKLNWIGRISSNVEITYVWHTVPVKTIEDLKTRETVVAATGPSSLTFPHMLNAMIGARFKTVRGYVGTPDANLAMQRGEVDGATSSINTVNASHPEWFERKLITTIVQYALRRSPRLPDVPAVVELGRSPDDRAILTFFASSSAVGRSIVAPPGLSSERITILRAAFDETMKDPSFISEVQQARAELDPLPGEELQKTILQIVNISNADRARARDFRAR
jgi:tripartite-type tricarboxylate transporter receptor subunit TctC